MDPPFLKFGYSWKATKFEKNLPLKRHQNLSGRFFSNFVVFSEYPIFKSIQQVNKLSYHTPSLVQCTTALFELAQNYYYAEL